MIIGAGVSGLSSALQLLNSGHPVTLLERGESGSESSWAGGGILSPLLPWDYAEPISGLALRSMAAYAGWIADIEARSGFSAEYWRCGMRAVDVSQPEAALEWCDSHSLTAMQDVSTRLSTLSPALSPQGGESHSIWLPDIAQVRNPRLVAAMREAIVGLGGVIHTHCAAEMAIAKAGRMTAVRTAMGVFAADQFVLTTGAWAGAPLPGMAGIPNIRPIRGQMLLFKLEPGALNTILYRNGLYLIPRRDGHILVGSTLEDVGFDKSTDEATRRRLHHEAAELLPALASAQPIRHWAGLRPGSPGNIPVIDRHPDFDNVYVNTGHFRYGVTMAPASAELLVDLMEGKTPTLDPSPYSWAAALTRSWADHP